MRKRNTPTETEHGTLVGHCAVDSGQIMLSDPCYVKGFKDEMDEGGEFVGDLPEPYPYTYNGASSATLQGDLRCGELGNGLGVCVSSGYGDGSYPVYVTLDESGRVATATIVFISNDEMSEWGDDEDEDDEQ